MESDDTPLGLAARRVLDHLKRHSPCTTAALADALDVTTPAVRTQIDALVDHGMVIGRTRPPTGRGRPATVWELTPLAIDAFPDRHRDLTVELLDAIRVSLGAEAVTAVLAERDDRHRRLLETAMADDADVGERVATLAEHRSAQGYMAEVIDNNDHLLLVEHHCPVCEAATACQGLCAGELQLFRDVLGPDAEVERTQHLLAGDSRCVYQIRSKP
ncbi:MAG: helix-turn-helix transcriptional regulator [Acidimicrobiales bacterium]